MKGHLCDHCGVFFQCDEPVCTYTHRMTWVDDDGKPTVEIVEGSLCEDCAVVESRKRGLIQAPNPAGEPNE